MGSLKVKDLMTEKVYSIRPDDTLARLNDLMSDFNVRHMPVVDEDGNLVGIVSHRDLLRSALDTLGALPVSEQRDLLKNTQVQEIMITDVETAEPDQAIEEAGAVMLENKLGCLPVLEGENLVGILTEADFIKYVIETSNT